MSVAVILKNFLMQEGVAYQVISHRPTESLEQAAELAGIPPRQMARAVVLKANDSLCMAVLPVSHILDFAALGELLQGEIQPVAAGDLASIFTDCEPGCIPPVGEAYGLRTSYDKALLESDFVVFESGSHRSLLRVGRDDLRRLTRNARTGEFSHQARAPQQAESCCAREGAPCNGDRSAAAAEDSSRAQGIKERIEAIYELPLMPELAQKILELKSDPDASAGDLAQVVELDPSLAVQVMRYARSPLFGYAGTVDNLEEAISRVLGFDMVMNLALGLAALQPFRTPLDGPLGLHAFWRHATYSATLAQRLARAIPQQLRPTPATAYLAGLLHNFGFLLFGHLFHPEFYLLNKMVAANPRMAVTTLERQVLCMGQAREVLCMGHAEAGAWLMKSWSMPEEVIVATCEHHSEEYCGPHAVYANLVLIVDHLLKRHDIGDAQHGDLPAAMLERLGLDEATADQLARELLQGCEGVEDMIDQSVA